MTKSLEEGDSLPFVEGEMVGDQLFQELKSVMEKEVAEMPHIASRREFLQKIAMCSAVVPLSVLSLAGDVRGDGLTRGCWLCVSDVCAGIQCRECLGDTCIVWDPDASGCGKPCMNCINQGRAGCQAGRCDSDCNTNMQGG